MAGRKYGELCTKGRQCDSEICRNGRCDANLGYPRCTIASDCKGKEYCIGRGTPLTRGYCLKIKHWIPQCLEACNHMRYDVHCKKSCRCYGKCIKGGHNLKDCGHCKIEKGHKLKGFLERLFEVFKKAGCSRCGR